MLGLQPLLAFSETAKLGGFAAAARVLGTSPSALAKAVGRLEASLGLRLFYRTTRQVTLTADGERLFEHVDELLRSKRWEAISGYELTDEMLVTVAANAAIPVLSFDTWPYRQVKSIIIRPSAVVSSGVRSGPVAGT